MENYAVYEHIVGLPDYLDTRMDGLEDFLAESGYTAGEAEEYVKNAERVPETDRYGRKRRVYIYKY